MKKWAVIALPLVAAAAVAWVLLAAQGSSGSASIQGTFELCGGPPPGRCFSQGGEVSILGSARRLVASEHSSDGRFDFQLAPGDYSIAVSPCGAVPQKSVHMLADKTAVVKVTCNDVP